MSLAAEIDRSADQLVTVLVVPPLIHAGVAFTSVAGPEHIGVAYLAASLRREGIKTIILNFDLDTYLKVMKHEGFVEIQPDPVDMADRILAENPAFVGITVTGPTLYWNFATELRGTSGPRDERTQSLPRASTVAWSRPSAFIRTLLICQREAARVAVRRLRRGIVAGSRRRPGRWRRR